MKARRIASLLAAFAFGTGIALPASGPAVKRLPPTEIFVVKADGTDRRNLTRNPASDDQPALVPDGRRLVFIREPGKLWVMNADGRQQRRLANASGWVGLRWSPDGSQIAFSHSTPNTNSPTRYLYEVGLFAPSGNGLRWITDAARPSWTPDGKRLAFLTDFGAFREGPDAIAVANSDGSGRRLVIQASDLGAYSVGLPQWSPAGSRIAFWGYGGDGGSNFPFYVVEADNPSSVRRVGANGYNLAWSPDGRRLAFRGRVGISVVTVDASRPRLLVRSGRYGNPRNPVWSPDGRRIAFVASAGPGNVKQCDAYCPGRLLVVNPDGGRPHILATGVQARGHPIWSRDSRKIYFVGYTQPRRH